MGPDFERQTGVCETSLSAPEQAGSGFEPTSDDEHAELTDTDQAEAG